MIMHQQQGNKEAPLSIFISYAHEDELMCEQLETHLSLLRRQGWIADWHDRQILAGQEWARAIDQHLETASIILLLISPDFLASDYCYDIEMRRALERHARSEAHVIPIILRPVDWTNAPFAALQCFPHDGRAVSQWSDPDLAFREITRGIRHAVEQLCETPDPRQREASSRVGRTQRQRLIKRVHADWITGVLERSLHQALLIELGLHEQSDALANPWHLTIQEMNHAARPLPEGTHITQVYDEADGELLILGEPGAGKTTLLLALARDLLKRAEEEQNHPVPVVFNLSSWSIKRQPLAIWLIEELCTKYRLSRRVATSWINEDHLILLLDGLDEVAPSVRSACVQAVNAYQRAHDLVSLVVCSRSGEYFAQTQRLLLQQAVMIQPLTAEQVETYLSRLGERGAGVHQLLQEDLWLRELMTTPLMLSILILAYQGRSTQDLPTAVPLSPTQFEQAVADLRASYGCLLDAQSATPEASQALLAVQTASEQLLLVGRSAARRRHLFATYTERMLHRRGLATYPPQQTIQWLSWLAKTMLLNDQMVFSLERPLKNLPNPPPRNYHLLGLLVWLPLIGLIGGLVGGLVGGLIPVLVGGLVAVLVPLLIGGLVGRLVGEPEGRLFGGLVVGLVGGLVVGLLFGLVIGLTTAALWN